MEGVQHHLAIAVAGLRRRHDRDDLFHFRQELALARDADEWPRLS
jgi:hypothetical protein